MTETSTLHDTSLGFGIGEIAYLIQLVDSPAAHSSARWFRVEDETKDMAMLRSGVSSLIARGLARPTAQGDIAFDTKVDLVVYTLAQAHHWTQIDLLQDGNAGDSVLHVESDKTAMLFQPRTMQSWFALPQDPSVTPASAEAYLIREHLAATPDGGVRIRSGVFGSGISLLVRKGVEGWVTARSHGDAVETSVPLHDEELEGRIERFRQESSA